MVSRMCVTLWLLAVANLCAAQSTRPASKSSPLAGRIGSAHVGGTYNFTANDYLNEGADRILDTGMRVIKVYLFNPQGYYKFNSQWPKFKTLVDMAKHPYYRELFSKPFSTYVMTVYTMGKNHGEDWREGFSDRRYQDEKKQMYELTKYLLQTYKGADKTFVLQNWEGDWALRGSSNAEPSADPGEKAIEGMIRWMNARQEGVEQAREEVKGSKAKVYHACEMNLVNIAMQGRPTVINSVVPKTHCDLYSYSSYDTIGIAADDPAKGKEMFRKALDYIASKAPDSKAFGAKNVYVGEFGWPEVKSSQDPNASTEKCLQVNRMTVETALEWGCPYIVYWQVYDNESRVKNQKPTNGDVRGFYLIKPDGSSAAVRNYFVSLLK